MGIYTEVVTSQLHRFDHYLFLDIVSDIEDETIVGVVWPSQLQLVKVDWDQVSFHLNFCKFIY